MADAAVYVSCGTLTVSRGSAEPFTWMNSACCGVVNTLTVLPDWLVNVRLLNVTFICEI